MIRLVHFSDIHLFQPGARWKTREYFSKRVTGFVNNRFLPRSQHFKQASVVLHRLVEDAYSKSPDLVIFSGDATTLGVEEEFAQASELLRIEQAETPTALAVPGNHDYYTTHSVKQGLFERHFAKWQHGERLDEEIYPFARRIGPLFIVAVNSCQWNRWSWDSTGMVGVDQLVRLERMLASDTVADCIKILVTHYPVALANGRPERRQRRLRDLNDLLAVATKYGVQLWLHGHRHHSYLVPATPERPVAALCVGSGTMHDHWSYGEYLFDQSKFIVRQHTYQPELGKFAHSQEMVLSLKSPGTGK